MKTKQTKRDRARIGIEKLRRFAADQKLPPPDIRAAIVKWATKKLDTV